MELAMSHDWYEKLSPSLRENYEAWKKRKDDHKLELWEKVKLGEVMPNKIYMPITAEEGQCELCGGTGYRHYWENGQELMEQCECYNKIQFDRNMKKSGANPNMTLDNFFMDMEYQKEMSMKASEFAFGGYLSGQWFFAGGQVGSGKTHICTAILHELIKVNLGCRYMAWKDESVQLKALIKEQQEYHYRLMEICNAPVLYIDDLWKTQQGTKPTQADVNLAFQIINHRYQNKKYVTLISCEYTTDMLIKIDEAVGSRIFERSKGYRLNIETDASRNYRLRNN